MILMTYNIMHGLNYRKLLNKERSIELDNIVKVIQKYNPDIIALNEVYNDSHGIITVNQAKYIADKLGFDYYFFGKTITLDNGILYGNAIVSKHRIINPTIITIPDPIIKDENVYYESRNIISSKIDKYNVYVTHFGLAQKEQENALETLRQEIVNKKNVIIMGDFNIDEKNIFMINDSIQNTSNYKKRNNYTYPSTNPNKKIDYILLSKDINMQCLQIGEDIVSDHLPVIVSIN